MGKKKNLLKKTRIDRLSDLSPDILNMILLKLPLKDSIKTSILSKNWRCKWYCLSEFALKVGTDAKARYIVYQYQLHRDDAIIKFKLLDLRNIYVCEELPTWIHFLSTKGVKEFVLENCCPRISDLPLSLFAFKQLHYLELDYCNIKVPSSFQGFGCLSSLILKRVSINGEELETLIQKCCGLERLKLIEIVRLNNLISIHAPNLTYMEFDSRIEIIRFEDAKSLTCVDYSYKCNDPEIRPNLFAALGGLPRLESLIIHNAYDAFLPINENVVLSVNHLSVFHLYQRLHLNQENQMRVFLFILKRFPNLKKLNFSVFHPNDLSVDILEGLEPLRLNKLEAVSVDYDSPIRVLAKFLRHLITGNSPFLETLEITKCVPQGNKINENGKTTRFHKRLDKVFHKLKEVSPQLKIIHKARHE